MSSLWVAVDPGVVTGLFMWDGTNVIEATEGPALDMTYKIEQQLALVETANKIESHVVVEGVTIPRQSHIPAKAGFGQIESIGTVAYLAHKYRAELLPQDPSMRKVITLPMLQKIGWYFPSPNHHMIDAAKHLVVALLKKRIIKIEALLP